ncbi:MAG TPA: RloB domain-containing protein [Haloplasmataceae bacterium]
MNTKNYQIYSKIRKYFFNNFSFETWLLNHKSFFTSKILDKKDYDMFMYKIFKVQNWSSKKNLTQRKKIMNKIGLYDIQTALKNIEKISHEPFDNPSSNMNDLITIFHEINTDFIEII